MNKTQNRKLAGLILGGVLAATQTVYGANITIRDPNAGDNSNEIGFNGGPTGQGNEDNETESGYLGGFWHITTDSEQKWDLEAFSLNGTTLSLVSGFNLVGGQLDTETQTHVNPGHLFIKVGGTEQPVFDPLDDGGNPTTSNTYGYNYAVDLVSGKVYELDANSVLNTTTYDFFGSNPWSYSSGAVSESTILVEHDSDVDTTEAGNITGEDFSGLLGDASDPDNDNRYIAQLDLNDIFSMPLGGVDIWFHYAEECGNDVIKGRYTTNVPDGGASVALLGLGILGLAYFGRRVKTA